ncbi:glycine transaminase [Sarracenia purpurea var. burkii]
MGNGRELKLRTHELDFFNLKFVSCDCTDLRTSYFRSKKPPAHQKHSSVPENDAHFPKIPPFDYPPPPFTGSSAAEILQKRKRRLSPPMLCFYTKPRRLRVLKVSGERRRKTNVIQGHRNSGRCVEVAGVFHA